MTDEGAGNSPDGGTNQGASEAGQQAGTPASDGQEKPSGGAPASGTPAGAPDSGQEKASRPFDDATKSPSGKDSVDEAGAFRKGRRILKIGGDGVVVSDSHVRKLVVNVLQATMVRVTLGPVRDEVLEQNRARYVEVDGYGDLLNLLGERHIIMLRGADRTGRTTTALHLLDAVSGGNVSRLEPTDNHLLDAEHIEAGRGYLAELAPPAAAAFTEMHLDRLSALLAGESAWCVIVVGLEFVPDGPLTSYVAEVQPPNGRRVLQRHLAWATRDADTDAVTPLLGIADRPDVRTALGPAPSPAEMVALANLLLALGRSELTVEKVAAGCRELVDRTVIDWFRGGHEPERDDYGDRVLRLAGFRIALATLNQNPVHVVARLGELLAEHLIKARNTDRTPKVRNTDRTPKVRSTDRTPGRPVFTAEHSAWLAVSRAHLTPGVLELGNVTMPTELAEFRDARMPVVLLTQVWQRHHNAREPMLAWLRESTDHADPAVWVRAAQVVGLLCALDFTYVYHALIYEWSTADEQHSRHVAAYALDQAARNPDVRPLALELVRRWRASEEEAQMWTAAAVLGMDLGLARVETSLDDLCGMGVWHDDDKVDPAPLWSIASYSIAQLLALGAVEPVIARLQRWLKARRRSVRDVALQAIIYAADLRVANLRDIEVFDSPTSRSRWPQLADRSRWPFLLAMLSDDPRLTEPLADLVWRALDTTRSRPAMLRVLGGWMREGSDDPACLHAVAAFLMLLADTPRSTRRLQDLVNRLRNRLDRPLRADVADYLTQSLSIVSDGVTTR